jgi:hypothetical protein
LGCRPKGKKKIVKENLKCEKTFKMKMYIYITNTDKDYDLLQDRPTLPSGKTPHDKLYRNCLEYSQNLVMSSRGFNAKTN